MVAQDINEGLQVSVSDLVKTDIEEDITTLILKGFTEITVIATVVSASAHITDLEFRIKQGNSLTWDHVSSFTIPAPGYLPIAVKVIADYGALSLVVPPPPAGQSSDVTFRLTGLLKIGASP
jgi:hypothetical protein